MKGKRSGFLSIFNEPSHSTLLSSPTNPQTLILSFLSPTDRKRNIIILRTPGGRLSSEARCLRSEECGIGPVRPGAWSQPRHGAGPDTRDTRAALGQLRTPQSASLWSPANTGWGEG